MKAEQFVERLESLAPAISNLQNAGLTADEAIVERETYHCVKRPVPLTQQDSNEVISLLSGWLTGKVEVGMIRLLEEPVQVNKI